MGDTGYETCSVSWHRLIVECRIKSFGGICIGCTSGWGVWEREKTAKGKINEQRNAGKRDLIVSFLDDVEF